MQKICDMSLSPKTIKDRTSRMAEEITKQQIKDVNSAVPTLLPAISLKTIVILNK